MGWGFWYGGWWWAVCCLVPQFTCNIVRSSFYLLNLLFEQKAFIKQSKERSWTWAQRSGTCCVLYLSLLMVASNPLSYLFGLGSGRDRGGNGFFVSASVNGRNVRIPLTFFCWRTFSLLFASTELVAEVSGSRKRGWARLGIFGPFEYKDEDIVCILSSKTNTKSQREEIKRWETDSEGGLQSGGEMGESF